MFIHLLRTMALVSVMLSTASASLIAPPKEEVDLLLVLASDVSTSIDAAEFKMQRDGYAAAIADKQVLDAISSGIHGRIAVTYVEWSNNWQQHVVIPWMIVDGAEAAGHFADDLIEAKRSFSGRTAIAMAIDFSVKLIETSPYTAARKTIDISGDGTDNTGYDPKKSRAIATWKGIVINGVVILDTHPVGWVDDHSNPPGGLEKYYRDNVTGGPGSFVMVAKGFETFPEAIKKKLIAEIAMR